MARPAGPIWYGPFARLADLYHGWRDGAAGIPAKPAARPDRTTYKITTAHRETLIRRAQDSFERERLALEFDRADALDRMARCSAARRSQRAALATAEQELARILEPPTEAELTERRWSENRRALDLRSVRKRRRREHDRRCAEGRARVEALRRELAATEADLTVVRAELAQITRVIEARVVRIQEYTHRRLAAYRRRLSRSHPHGAWINEVLSSLDPNLPGWSATPYVDDGSPARPEPEPVAPDPPPVLRRILLQDRTVFGSSPDVDVHLDGYGVAHRHFEVRRVGAEFELRVLISGRGPYVGGQEVVHRRLRPGDEFDFADDRYRYLVTDEGAVLDVFRLGACDLVVAGLTAESNGQYRLIEMSFVQRKETVLVILGPSGAGKTSLFSALMGELAPTAGELFLRDLDLSTDADQIRTQLGFVPQDDDLHRTLTVRRLLRYADRLRSRAVGKAGRDKRIEEVCEALELTPRLDRVIATLSGGQRKRVSIALEILSRPTLLMLDEPTSGLDAGMDREVMRFLRRYAGEGRTVIVITHATEHLEYADQVLVVAAGGRLIYSGPPRGELTALGVRTYADLMRKLSDAGKDELAAMADAYARSRPAVEAHEEAQAAGARRRGPDHTARRRRSPMLLVSQMWVLIRRQLALIAARGAAKDPAKAKIWDRIRSPMAVAMPLLIAGGGAALAGGVGGAEGLDLAAGPEPGRQVATISLLTTLALLSGQALSYSDVVSEFPVIRREHRTGTSATAALMAKWLVFAVIAGVQSICIAAVYTLVRPPPTTSIRLPPWWELTTDLAALTIACMSLGLLISVVAQKLEQAVSLATLAAILQISLNGATATLPGLPNFVSLLLPARWGVAAAGSTVDLNRLVPMPEPDAMWDHTLSQWGTNIAALVTQSVVFLLLAILVLRRRLRPASRRNRPSRPAANA